MESYVPNENREEVEIQETIEVKVEIEKAIDEDPRELEQINEVTLAECEAEAIETRKKCLLQLHKAPFGKL